MQTYWSQPGQRRWAPCLKSSDFHARQQHFKAGLTLTTSRHWKLVRAFPQLHGM